MGGTGEKGTNRKVCNICVMCAVNQLSHGRSLSNCHVILVSMATEYMNALT